MDGFAAKDQSLKLCHIMLVGQRLQKNRRFGQKHAVVGINFAFFELRHRKDCNQPAHECNERVSAFVFRKNRCPQQGLCGQIYNFFASYAKYGALGHLKYVYARIAGFKT